ELPVEDVAAGPGFVAGPQVLPRSELADELGDGLRAIGDDPKEPDFPGRLGDRDGDGLSMDIEAQVAQVRRHRPAPFACSSAWFGSSDRVTYVLRSRAGHSIVTTIERAGV